MKKKLQKQSKRYRDTTEVGKSSQRGAKVGKRIVKKNLGGRPTKYYPSIYKEIEKYISMTGRENMELPTVEGLAIHLGVSRDTLHEWSKKYPKFSDTIKEILMKQKNQLMNDGMYGGKEINQAMAIFLLKVNHGMKEDSSTAVQVNIFTRLKEEDSEFIEGKEV